MKQNATLTTVAYRTDDAEPTCPKCKHYNAMLGTGNYVDAGFEILECRDCKHQALDYVRRRACTDCREDDRLINVATCVARHYQPKYEKLGGMEVLMEGTVEQFEKAAASGQPLSIFGLSQAISKEKTHEQK